MKKAQKRPVLVELKNGDNYLGKLVVCDHLMNMRLEEVTHYNRDSIILPDDPKFIIDKRSRCPKAKFLPEVSIKGMFVKFIRMPDNVITDAVDWERAKGKGRGKPSGSGVLAPDEISEDMNVPSEFVGVLIGKQGQTINSIVEMSAARVEVTREESKAAVWRKVIFSGGKKEVNAAKRLVVSKLEEFCGKVRRRPYELERIDDDDKVKIPSAAPSPKAGSRQTSNVSTSKEKSDKK